jgi:dolichyl-phosphate-mannose-protein mannosyltransferase
LIVKIPMRLPYTEPRFRHRIRGALAIAFLSIVAAGLLSACSKPDPAKNLVRNGDLSSGSDGLPAHWSPDWSRSASILRWHPPGAEPGELEIENLVPAAAKWDQMLLLRPGWYHVAADIRTDQVSGGHADIALLQSSGQSPPLGLVSGTNPWTHLEFYLLEHHWGGTLEIRCELGPNAVGRSWFRNIQVLPTAAPSVYERVVDLYPFGPARMPPPLSPDTGNLIGVGCGLLLLLLLGWGLFAIWRPALNTSSVVVLGLSVALLMTALELASVAHYEGLHWDIRSFAERAIQMAYRGPANYYDSRLGNDFYPPGTAYVQWLTGWLGTILMPGATGFRVLLQVPPIICSVLLALTIFYVALGTYTVNRALILMLFFVLNPGLFYNVAVWGQNDSMYALPMFLSFVLVLRGRPALGWAIAALAMMVKPQPVALLPVLGLITLLRQGPVQWTLSLVAVAIVIAIGFLPFQPNHPITLVPDVYAQIGGRFHSASSSAFNFPALVCGLRVPDSIRVAGVSYFALGGFLVLAIYDFVAWLVLRRAGDRAATLAAFIAVLGFFLFAPRMHERYAYAALVFLIPIALESPLLMTALLLLSAAYYSNLLYNMRAIEEMRFGASRDWIVICGALVNLTAFAGSVWYAVFKLPAQGSVGSLSRFNTRNRSGSPLLDQ